MDGAREFPRRSQPSETDTAILKDLDGCDTVFVSRSLVICDNAYTCVSEQLRLYERHRHVVFPWVRHWP